MKTKIQVLIAILATVLVTMFFAPPTQAIPAWTRKYNMDCATCHYPNPPRLNTFGHEFRRAGYRMSDEFNKDPDLSSVSHYIALRMRPRIFYKRVDTDPVTEDFELQLNDITLFYAGPIAAHASAFAEIEFEDEEDTSLLAQASGIWGNPKSFWTVRGGQAHVISRVGFGGFDRPTGISTTNLQADTLTDGGVPFRINGDQRFVEAAYVRGWNRVLVQLLNGVNPAGVGNEGRNFDTDNDKDFSVLYERILDDVASGFTAYSYVGNYHATDVPSDADKFRFYRFGFTANKIFAGGFEVQGGYIRARDNPPGDLPDIDGQGFYLDVEKYFGKPNFTIFGRFDYTDGNTDVDHNARRNFIVGFTKDVISNTRLAVEGRVIKNQQPPDIDKPTDFRLTGEVMVNF